MTPSPAPSRADKPLVVLKVDVDTHVGMRDGVPRLLQLFREHQVPATFFLSLGPDRSGRAMLQLRRPAFVRKMLRTNAPSLYGWRTILSGTVLPARPVALAFPELVRRIEAEGHETGVHAWDHRSWQDDLDHFKPHRIRLHYARAWDAYLRLTGHEPAGVAAPGWVANPLSLRIQDEFPFRYASDLRQAPACRLAVAGTLLRIPQIGSTGLCLEELLGIGITRPESLVHILSQQLLSAPRLAVLTLHAEVEGGPFAGILTGVLAGLRHRARVVTMQYAAHQLTPALASERTREWRRITLPGRAFPVSSASGADSCER